MGRLKLQPDPTFKAKVAIPIPGGRDEPVEFIFKYRNREALQEFMDRWNDEVLGAATLLDMCSGWDLTDPFDKDTLEVFSANYVTGPVAVYRKYLDEHTKAGAKN